MSRLPHASSILEAAEKWKKRCLLDGDSLFSEEKLWTHENFKELKEHFVDNLLTDERSFDEKIREQLQPSSPQAKKLWAEITWVYWLIVHQLKRETKLNKIRTTWEWSDSQLPEDHWALGEVLEKGILNPGTPYLAQAWREYRFIVVLLLDWTSLGLDERVNLLEDPWRFADWVDSHVEGVRQFRHALLYLLFPEEFEPSVSGRHKQSIVKELQGEAGLDMDVDSLTETGKNLDKAVLEIRKRLQERNPGHEINFYTSPYRERWFEGEIEPVLETEAETWFRERFGIKNVWISVPGGNATLWDEFLAHGIVAVPWDELGDLSQYRTKAEMRSALVKAGAGENPIHRLAMMWGFANEVNIGDIVLAKRGARDIIGWGEVTGEYVFDSGRIKYKHVRAATWKSCNPPIDLRHSSRTVRLRKFTDKDAIQKVFSEIDSRDPIEEGLKELFLDKTQFLRILNSLDSRKNVILQGPPGVGKTFIARRIAKTLVGLEDPKTIQMVQFHQSYAYEDFIQGFRPTEQGGFVLRNGPFFEFCKLAEKHPDRKYVFIIDEINRGNLSRIFGELLMLIEADKRGAEYAIALTYMNPKERFSVPENVYILGLMNTADRSLAIVDYALRRRFAFETLQPAFGTQKFNEYLASKGLNADLVDRIGSKLHELNEKISTDKDLGDGFLIGHSYFVPTREEDDAWYEDVVKTQIEPLLNEYWFDRHDQVKDAVVGLLE